MTHAAAPTVQGGVTRVGAAHQPPPAYEVDSVLAGDPPTPPPHRHWCKTSVRGVGRVRVAVRRYDARMAGILSVLHRSMQQERQDHQKTRVYASGVHPPQKCTPLAYNSICNVIGCCLWYNKSSARSTFTSSP
ncbi:MAG: hypothetical protein ABI947_14525 [Chloroflexota bacterium]